MPAPVAAAWMLVTLAVPMVVADAPADRLAVMRADFGTLLELGSEA